MHINYFLYLNQSGYSLAGQEYVLSLLKADPKLSIKCFSLAGDTNLGLSLDRSKLFSDLKQTKEQENHIDIYHSVPGLYKLHEHKKNIHNAKKTVGICLFETMNPNKSWIEKMKSVDHIVTASEFNRRIFLSNGYNKNITNIPHCFDPEMFNKDVQTQGRYSLFTFLSIGTFKQRKNWDNLIKGFYQAFDKKNKVCLLIKTDKINEMKFLIRSIKNNSEFKSKDTAHIFVEEKPVCTLEEIPKIMKKADVCVCPSLGEGFGYFGLHAMALNIPLVITRYSGNLEYAKEGFVTYIEPKKYKSYPIMDKIPQFHNCIWPVVSPSDIAESLLKAFQSNLINKAIKGYEYVHSHFTQQVIGNKFLDFLKSI